MNSCCTDSTLKALIHCELTDSALECAEEHLLKCESCRKRLNELEKEAEPIFDFSRIQSSYASSSELNQFEKRFSQFLNTETELELPFRIGFYEIQKIIGKGGMGIVYEAEHIYLHRKTAIKFIRNRPHVSPKLQTRFLQEIYASGQLQHPNIVTALDAGVFEGRNFLVMELLQGENLAQYVARRGKLPLHEAVTITIQAAQGLLHAHKAGLIHCDIKPSNLWRCPDGTIKILDLGLMQPFSSTNDGPSLHHGGTPIFMSPEQVEHQNCLNEKTDLYSLGCTFFFLLTGEIPDRSQPNWANVRKTGIQIPRKVQKILNRMTAEQPEKRFNSMEQTAHALLPFQKEKGPFELVLLGYLAFLTALILYPIFFGIWGFYLGFQNQKNGYPRHGFLQIFLTSISMAFGILIGAFTYILEEEEGLEETPPAVSESFDDSAVNPAVNPSDSAVNPSDSAVNPGDSAVNPGESAEKPGESAVNLNDSPNDSPAEFITPAEKADN